MPKAAKDRAERIERMVACLGRYAESCDVKRGWAPVFAVAVLIALRCAETGTCRIGIRTLAKDSGLSDGAVKRAVGLLQAVGVIQRETQKFGPAVLAWTAQ